MDGLHPIFWSAVKQKTRLFLMYVLVVGSTCLTAMSVAMVLVLGGDPDVPRGVTPPNTGLMSVTALSGVLAGTVAAAWGMERIRSLRKHLNSHPE